MRATSCQMASKPVANASLVKGESNQGRSFKCCDHCGLMAPCNNKKKCNGCATLFLVPENKNSKQGKSFKCCGDCGNMAGSNNQTACKYCTRTNWVKKTKKNTSKRKSPTLRKSSPGHVNKKRKISDKKRAKRVSDKKSASSVVLLDSFLLLNESLLLESFGCDSESLSFKNDTNSMTLGANDLFSDAIEFMKEMDDVKFVKEIDDIKFMKEIDDIDSVKEMDAVEIAAMEVELSSDCWLDNLLSEISQPPGGSEATGGISV